MTSMHRFSSRRVHSAFHKVFGNCRNVLYISTNLIPCPKVRVKKLLAIPLPLFDCRFALPLGEIFVFPQHCPFQKIEYWSGTFSPVYVCVGRLPQQLSRLPQQLSRNMSKFGRNFADYLNNFHEIWANLEEILLSRVGCKMQSKR